MLKRGSIIASIFLVPIFVWFFWPTQEIAPLSSLTNQREKAGEAALQDLFATPALALQETGDRFGIVDDAEEGIQIAYPNQERKDIPKKELKVNFPKNYSKPLEVDLGDGKILTITDLSGNNRYASRVLSGDDQGQSEAQSFFQRLFSRDNEEVSERAEYLSYTSSDERKTLLYAYQKDRATGERKLKHWTLYQSGNGTEKESYRIDGAIVNIDSEGNARVFYEDKNQTLQTERVKGEVDPSLLDRAQKFLEQEIGSSGEGNPDFIIPKPYYIDRNGDKKDLDWSWEKEKGILSLEFTVKTDLYPVALDPTLQFSVPGGNTAGAVIQGETASSNFGGSLASGDFNADGKVDLAIGAFSGGTSSQGKVYVFYGGTISSKQSTTADVVFAGAATTDNLGSSLVAGDFNSDGRTDLAAGGYFHEKVSIFYGGSMRSGLAGTVSDVNLTGTSGTQFGWALEAGDFNADGRTDLVVGANAYSTNTGRAYIFYNDGSMPTTDATADVTITGEASTQFGYSFSSGDYNTDGETDLLVGAYAHSTNTGRAYVFYNDGSIPTTAAGADVMITGESSNNYFGWALTSGDFNADGKVDFAVGGKGHSGGTFLGRAYIFYADGTNNFGTAGCTGASPTACLAANADVVITGESAGSRPGFGASLASGDMNGDGRTDLLVGAIHYTTDIGYVYIFYNDGSISTTAATADVIISGEGASNHFGVSIVTGDFNADGRVDMATGASRYALLTGRVYIFYSQNGQINTNQAIPGETTNNYFGYAQTAGDFNADGKIDLAVGAYGNTSSAGKVYIFYGTGRYPTAATSADVTITGTTAGDQFGISLSAGDLNSDGETDLLVGANGVSTNTGNAYIFYNDGSIPTTAATADIIIAGETTNNYFGESIITGDFNADGRTDVIVSAHGNSSNNGRVYIFYNDGTSLGTVVCTTGCLASNKDVGIDGSATRQFFGRAMIVGDFDTDGDMDFTASSTYGFGGHAYAHIFYNDGSYPAAAASAEVSIDNGASATTFSGAAGDFNADGRTDIALGFTDVSSSNGRVYLYYNDGSYPTLDTTADRTITSTAGALFGKTLVAGDFNADGRTDLVVSMTAVTTNTGKVFVFYNDGSIPTNDTTADMTIVGETTNNYFGRSLLSADFNNDGRTDLIVGADGNTTNTGKVYFYETHENFAWDLQRTVSVRAQANGSGQEMNITGEASSSFGSAFATGDFNADGKIDLAVGAPDYLTNTGRVYLFYSDGSLAKDAIQADEVITGESTSNYFGSAMIVGDFNSDGKTDLVVGAHGYSSSIGRAYIFYNDGSYVSLAASADTILTGGFHPAAGATTDFGSAFAALDINNDGRTDLITDSHAFGGGVGYVNFFYNDGSYPTGESTEDGAILGGSTSSFGLSIETGVDFNVDGKADIAVGGKTRNSNQGEVRIFYNDGTIPTSGASADVTITGTTGGDFFGYSLSSADLDADGKKDLIVGANGRSSNAGAAYVFYGDGSTPTTAAAADIIITGESSSALGSSLTGGDFNADGRIDLAVGATSYTTSTGRAYIFYNDGSIPTTAANADMILTGEATNNSFGTSMTSSDLNADGRADLMVGASGYSSKGRVYLYTPGNDPIIAGEASSQFGQTLVSGDLNADGKIDLAVGASAYSTNTGRVYIFYNNSGSMKTTAATADVIITGEATGNYFGESLAIGDLNVDGKADLAVGASGKPAVYIFYNDGSYTSSAATADVALTAAATNVGTGIAIGDLNSDGKNDILVTAFGFSTDGRAHLFYSDGTNDFGSATCTGSLPTVCSPSSADIIVSGTGGKRMAFQAIEDINADGRLDMVLGGTNGTSGGVYVLYNDGSSFGTVACTTACSVANADLTISGENSGDNFGHQIVFSDLDWDGKKDVVVSAPGYSTSTGRVYVFYNDGSIPTTAATADVIITGEATTNYFGYSLIVGDFNADGRNDFMAGAYGNSGGVGRVYAFYNDGSIPTTAATADYSMSGTGGSQYFGEALSILDFNVDNKADPVVGSYGYLSSAGRVYIFTSEVNSAQAVNGLQETKRIRGSAKFKGTVQWK